MRLKKLVVLSPLCMALVGCGGTSNINTNGPLEPSGLGSVSQAETPCNADLQSFQAAVVGLVNESRRKARQCGVRRFAAVADLYWDDRLALAAEAHSLDMARNNLFSHTGSNGLIVSDRALAAGYDWRAIGENIAAGQPTVESAHSGWLTSPGHCSNIMGSDYASVGAGCVFSENGEFETYWTVVFGGE